MNCLGVLMLDTRFPRLRGDIGNPRTFDHPVRYAVVEGASPQRVVRESDPDLLLPFIAAGRRLVAEGAGAIATSCGFLVLWQRELQAALPVPVWTSSLLLVPELHAGRPADGRVGVLTVDAQSLGVRHLQAAGAAPDTPLEGLEPGSPFQRSLLDNRTELDAGDARLQVVGAAERLLERHPGVADIVLECTNMSPYADAVRRATGRRVHDVTTLIAQRFAAQTH
ncbi:MAG: aspartate/glutamate racemase family protein [Burkholderiaceae bacterium]